MAIASIAEPAAPALRAIPSVHVRRHSFKIDPRTRSEIESWNDAVDRRKAEKRREA